MGLEKFTIIETYIQPTLGLEIPNVASYIDEPAEYKAFWYPRPHESQISDNDISDLEPVDDQDDDTVA